MSARDEFLKSVRDAIQAGSGAHHEVSSSSVTFGGPTDIRARAEDARRIADAKRPQAIETLVKMAQLQAWNLIRVPSRDGAAQAVAAIAVELGAKLAVRTQHPVFTGMPLDKALADKGVRVQAMNMAEAPPAMLRKTAAAADMGVTGVDWVVAETATAVLISERGKARTASLLPPAHIAVVEANQVVPTLAEALALVQGYVAEKGWAGHYVNLISGPSRTADIEQTIVIGVHGPGKVYLVLIG